MSSSFDRMNLNDERAGSRLQQIDESSSKLVNSMAQAYLNSGNTSEAELKRRSEFMEKQRELLTEKKRVERQKQLENFMQQSNGEEGSLMQARPMSSRAARSVLAGAEPNQIPQSSLSSNKSDQERKKMEARKALAETLKKEVINQARKN